MSSFFFLNRIDRKLEKVLRPYINMEVERLTNNIVTKAVTDMNLSRKVEEYVQIERTNGKIEHISYRTNTINEITRDVTRVIQDTLKNIDSGEIDEYFLSNRVKTGKFQLVQNGILCEVSLGSIRNSILFSNIGPTIPIRLFFLGQANTEIKIDTREYGVNNVMIEVNLIIKVQEVVSMPISSLKKEIVIKEPLSVEIIQGDLPHYIGGIK